MKAFVIDPFEKTIAEFEFGDLKEAFRQIGPVLLDSVRFTRENRDTAFVDDEGLLKPDQKFFMIGEYPSPLAGKALVLGCDPYGETISVETSISELNVRWVD